MAPTACCYYSITTGERQGCHDNVERSTCLEGGAFGSLIGIPHPADGVHCDDITCPEDAYSIPCCIPEGEPLSPCVSVPLFHCINVLDGNSHPFPQNHWCPRDDPGIAPCFPINLGACCLLDGTCYDGITGDQCDLLNGAWQGDNTECTAIECPPYPEECRTAQPPRPAVGPDGQPLRDWTTDLCAAALFVPYARPNEDRPESLEEGDEPGFVFGEGDMELLSLNPVRAMMVDNPTNASDPCRQHYAKIARMTNGDSGAAFCSQPGSQPREDRQFSIGNLYCEPPSSGRWIRGQWVPDTKDPDSVLQPGDCAFLGLYHTPFWTEALYHSEAPVCGGIAF